LITREGLSQPHAVAKCIGMSEMKKKKKTKKGK
jgi:hypothetical protein